MFCANVARAQRFHYVVRETGGETIESLCYISLYHWDSITRFTRSRMTRTMSVSSFYLSPVVLCSVYVTLGIHSATFTTFISVGMTRINNNVIPSGATLLRSHASKACLAL